MYALSDGSEAQLRQPCDHDHADLCDRCKGLRETLAATERVLNETNFPSDDDKDEAVFMFQTAKSAIYAWKSHILRSTNQDQARLDALIVNDWAMKFLPQRYRESQADWFGRREISWHISIVHRRLGGVFQWQGFIHIVQSCKQDSSAVVGIMQDVLRTIKSRERRNRESLPPTG